MQKFKQFVSSISAGILRHGIDLRRRAHVRQLRVSETLSLGEKRQLLIVECGDRQLLIGAAGNFLTTLAELQCVAAKEKD